MRSYLFVLMALLFVSSAALAQQTAFNQTQWATCQRKDPFDEYIYHAPLVTGITVDGHPADWGQFPLLEWAPINHWCESGKS